MSDRASPVPPLTLSSKYYVALNRYPYFPLSCSGDAAVDVERAEFSGRLLYRTTEELSVLRKPGISIRQRRSELEMSTLRLPKQKRSAKPLVISDDRFDTSRM